MIYYSYFKYILEYFKANRYYSIFRVFFKLLALINILLGLFTLIVFTDFRYDEYKNFINYNLYNFSFSDFLFRFRSNLKRIFKSISNLFDDDKIVPDNSDKLPNSYKYPDTYNIGKEGVKSDSYLPYYALVLFTIIVCYNYPEYTITPVISGITGFFSSFFGGSDDKPAPNPTSDPLNKPTSDPLTNTLKKR